MKKTLLLSVALTLLTCPAPNAQEVIKVETAEAASPSAPTAEDDLKSFLISEENRICSELRNFAREQIFKDEAFMAAVQDRNTRSVARATEKYTDILVKNFDADFLFYHPNTRFFIRIKDKGYRGRMKLPAAVSEAPSACYWERLPSQDLVYSMLIKIDGEKTGYLKISKKLTHMVSAMPDVLSPYGHSRIYTALDKTGLKKMAWFKMRRKEANRTRHSGWCTANNLAFLTSVGSAPVLTKKQQKKLLYLSDHTDKFSLPDIGLSGGTIALSDLYGERLGAIVYTVSPTNEKYPDVSSIPGEKEADCLQEEKEENILYRLFD